jgi:predicted porin
MNKTENDRSMDYALRAVVSPLKDLNLSGNYYGGKAEGTDFSFYDFGIDYRTGSLFIDAEYSNKNTKTIVSDFSGTSLFAFATYNIPLGGDFLKEIIPAFRYEKYDPNKSADKNEIDMMTFGLTFEFAKITFAHFRINYELYDYKDGSKNPNKLILELQTRF